MQRLHHRLGRVAFDEVAGADLGGEGLHRLALRGAGHIGQQALALRREHGHGLDAALLDRLDLAQPVGGDEDVHLAAHQVAQRVGAALVGHMGHGYAQVFGQLAAQQVVERAHAHAGIGQGLALLGHAGGVGDQLVAVGHRQVGARQNRHGRQANAVHLAEVLGLVFD